jgi:hypothetical protein
MITIYIEQITKNCYSFITPYKWPTFLYEKSERAAKRQFIRYFNLKGTTNIKFERIKK